MAIALVILIDRNELREEEGQRVRAFTTSLALGLLAGGASPYGLASEFSDRVDQELRLLSESPEIYPLRPAQKWGSSSARRVTDTLREQTRREIMGPVDLLSESPPWTPLAEPVRSHDDAAELVDVSRLVRDLEEMEQLELTSARLPRQPWSDDYWAIYRGGLGARYEEGAFPASSDWSDNHQFIAQFPALDLIRNHGQNAVERLSPSEKYDLVIGTQENMLMLTDRQWKEGKRYYDLTGSVEPWMGICHGWAAAAFMMPRPAKKITVPSADGQWQIPFYPSDIKALASLLWAKSRTTTRFVGGRCDTQRPDRDTNGRIEEDECFDTNPWTWHQAVVNQIGRAKRSFVLDVNYDYEVWNQPVLSYEYTYFHPQTRARVATREEATLMLNEFSDDPYRRYRSRSSKSVVGIAMQVTYMVETSPTHRERDQPAFDGKQSVLYLYDLELDGLGQVLGGEWYSDAHPDFLWIPEQGSSAVTVGDHYMLGQPLWDGEAPLSTRWTENAARSSRRGQPLGKLVKSLVQLAR